MWDKLILYFIIMSFFGWIYESLAMTIYHHKWENRGFLFGPVIPIYGVGSVIGLCVFNLHFVDATWWQVFLFGAIGSVILEYPTSYILEKIFHAKWWDYSIAPLNIKGRVCLPATLGFGVGALLIVFVINPFLWPIINSLNSELVSVISSILTVIITIDLTTTIVVLKSFEKTIVSVDEIINGKMTAAVDKVKNVGTSVINKTLKLIDPKNIPILRKVVSYDYKSSPSINKLLNEINKRIRKKD